MNNDHVAPIHGMPVQEKPWEGSLARKPWDYPVTAAIVHRDTPEMLAGVVELLRGQSMAPYILVIDTGSGPASQATLDELDAADDCEVHYLRSKGWRGSSCPVAAAMDVAFALCQTEFLFSTHTDVFPLRADMIAHVVEKCGARTPVVGWQMSPRETWPNDSWEDTPSHTASAYHMKTMRSIGGSWNMLRAFDLLHQPHGQTTGGYPDTETTLGLVLADHDITPRWEKDPDDDGRHILFLGPEPNAPYRTNWFTHIRSTGSIVVYHPKSLVSEIRFNLVRRELAAIPGRLQEWAEAANAKRP